MPISERRTHETELGSRGTYEAFIVLVVAASA